MNAMCLLYGPRRERIGDAARLAAIAATYWACDICEDRKYCTRLDVWASPLLWSDIASPGVIYKPRHGNAARMLAVCPACVSMPKGVDLVTCDDCSASLLLAPYSGRTCGPCQDDRDTRTCDMCAEVHSGEASDMRAGWGFASICPECVDHPECQQNGCGARCEEVEIWTLGGEPSCNSCYIDDQGEKCAGCEAKFLLCDLTDLVTGHCQGDRGDYCQGCIEDMFQCEDCKIYVHTDWDYSAYDGHQDRDLCRGCYDYCPECGEYGDGLCHQCPDEHEGRRHCGCLDDEGEADDEGEIVVPGLWAASF